MDKSSGKPFYSAAPKGGVVDVSPFMAPAGKGGSSGGERWSREVDLSALQSMDADVDFSATDSSPTRLPITAPSPHTRRMLTIKHQRQHLWRHRSDGHAGQPRRADFNGHVTGNNAAVSQPWAAASQPHHRVRCLR
jgi:hypothetical protein